jgi:hypothetical protein
MPDRGNSNHSYLFELPTEYTSGIVCLTGYLNPTTEAHRGRSPVETSYNNNTKKVCVTFQAVPGLKLTIDRVSYTTSAGKWNTSVASVKQLQEWLKAAYPIKVLSSRTDTYTVGKTITMNAKQEATNYSWSDLNAALAKKYQVKRVSCRSRPCEDTRPPDPFASAYHFGLATHLGGQLDPKYLGMAVSIPGKTASGSTKDETTGIHELGHLLGRKHTPRACEAKGGDDKYPYPDANLGPALTGPTAIYGFNIHTHDIYDPAEWKDLMGYCRPRWPSDYRES